MTTPNIFSARPEELPGLLQQLSDRLRQLEVRFPENSEGWANNQTNVTQDRAFDANSTTTAELADVLGTLITDLIDAGVLK